MNLGTKTVGFVFVALASVLAVTSGATTATEYKQECIVDKTKEATVEGNYKDCTTEAHVADGSIDCCDVDGVIDCCNKSASWRELILICVAILTTTIILSLLCVWIYWCDEQMCPWIGPYKRKWDEKTGKCQRKVCCCCVGDDDDDDYRTQARALPRKTGGGLPEQEDRPESTLSGFTEGDGVLSRPGSMHTSAIDVRVEKTEMPPEYRAEVKDDFLNF